MSARHGAGEENQRRRCGVAPQQHVPHATLLRTANSGLSAGQVQTNTALRGCEQARAQHSGVHGRGGGVLAAPSRTHQYFWLSSRNWTSTDGTRRPDSALFTRPMKTSPGVSMLQEGQPSGVAAGIAQPRCHELQVLAKLSVR